MANQYTGSTNDKCLKKYGMTLEEKLKEMAAQDYTWAAAAEGIGCSKTIIKKYCKQYGLELRKINHGEKNNLRDQENEKYNFLYRKWG